MHLKINTKEKFNEISLIEPHFTAIMAADIVVELEEFLQKDVKNIILRLNNVTAIDMLAAEALVSLQHDFYESGVSLVLCEMQPEVEKILDESQLLESLNIAPTLSEAWDIVQMEEIEREFLDNSGL